MPTPSRFAKENELVMPNLTNSKPRRGRNSNIPPSTPFANIQPTAVGVPPRLRSNLLPAPIPALSPALSSQSLRQLPAPRQPVPGPPHPRTDPQYAGTPSQRPQPAKQSLGPPQDQHPSTPVDTLPDGMLAALQAELAASQHRLAESEARQDELRSQLLAVETTRPQRKIMKVIPIPKPKGEAGDGFQLRKVMQLDDNEAKIILYTSIRRTVHNCARSAGVDFSKPYSQQSCEVLADVFKAARQTHPYLTPSRFPNDWATAELLKQYIRNVRAQECRLRKQAADASNTATEAIQEAIPQAPSLAKRAAPMNSDREGLEEYRRPSKKCRVSYLPPLESHSKMARQQPEAGPSRHPEVLFLDNNNGNDYDDDSDNDDTINPFNVEDTSFY